MSALGRMVAEAIAVIAVACVLAVAVYGCTTSEVIQAGTGETLQETLDRECLERGLTCARVYEFAQAAENEIGRVEMCVREVDLPLAEALYGDSAWTSRAAFDRFYVLGVEPMCVWCAGFGCNALGSPGPVPAPSCFNCPAVKL